MKKLLAIVGVFGLLASSGLFTNNAQAMKKVNSTNEGVPHDGGAGGGGASCNGTIFCP